MSDQKWKKEMVFPDNLSNLDIELIWQQCQIQGVDDNSEAVWGFAQAYGVIKHRSTGKSFPTTAERTEILIKYLAAMLDPKNNIRGYRIVPAQYFPGKDAVAYDLVPRAMSNLLQAYFEGNLNATEVYTEFEKIHPFFDGNGRVGDLLWKMLVTRETGKWPEELPPNIFGEDRSMIED